VGNSFLPPSLRSPLPRPRPTKPKTPAGAKASEIKTAASSRTAAQFSRGRDPQA
jgi:hypothetical protein